MKRIYSIVLQTKHDDPSVFLVFAEDMSRAGAIEHLKSIGEWKDEWDDEDEYDDVYLTIVGHDNEPLEELAQQLKEPDVDDAEIILGGVYETLGLRTPSFLED